MDLFVWALIGFVFIHVGVSATGLRGQLVARLGEWGYRGVFSTASIVLLGLMIWGFAQVRGDPYDPLNAWLWIPPVWTRHVTHLLVLLGFLLIVPGVLAPGPTTVGLEGRVEREEPAKGMMRISRHPFLWGVSLWALGHLLSNGERYSVMLFGALFAMALLGTRSIDRKGRARDPEHYARFEAVTSNVPFAAILQGRNKLVLSEIWPLLLVALIAFAAFGYFHRILIGVSAFAFGA